MHRPFPRRSRTVDWRAFVWHTRARAYVYLYAYPSVPSGPLRPPLSPVYFCKYKRVRKSSIIRLSAYIRNVCCGRPRAQFISRKYAPTANFSFWHVLPPLGCSFPFACFFYFSFPVLFIYFYFFVVITIICRPVLEKTLLRAKAWITNRIRIENAFCLN